MVRRLIVTCVFGVAMSAGCSGARIDGNEAATIGDIRAIVSAQIVHSSSCNFSYGASLPALGARGYLGAALALPTPFTKNGYRFTFSTVKGDMASDCGDPVADYELHAEPEQPGSTGTRYFRTKSDGKLEEATSATFSDARPVK